MADGLDGEALVPNDVGEQKPLSGPGGNGQDLVQNAPEEQNTVLTALARRTQAMEGFCEFVDRVKNRPQRHEAVGCWLPVGQPEQPQLDDDKRVPVSNDAAAGGLVLPVQDNIVHSLVHGQDRQQQQRVRRQLDPEDDEVAGLVALGLGRVGDQGDTHMQEIWRPPICRAPEYVNWAIYHEPLAYSRWMTYGDATEMAIWLKRVQFSESAQRAQAVEFLNNIRSSAVVDRGTRFPNGTYINLDGFEMRCLVARIFLLLSWTDARPDAPFSGAAIHRNYNDASRSYLVAVNEINTFVYSPRSLWDCRKFEAHHALLWRD